MSAELAALLQRLDAKDFIGAELDRLFAIVMDGEAAPEQVKPFLLASIPLMGDAQALAAGARAMRARMIAVRAPEGAIDVCGTGGDGAHTLNISTAVAFVAAGAGVPVAKHGNRAMSSKSGAADVLEALGVKLTAHVSTLERCLDEAGVAFLFAQNHHPAMRHVAAARRELGQRTIFNLLGPLANPANVKRQLVGVFAPEFVRPMAQALHDHLGAEAVCVVHGAGGLDELTPIRGAAHVLPISLDPGALEPPPLARDFSDDAASVLAGLRGGDAPANAHALRALLDGESHDLYRTAVVWNAAHALAAAGVADLHLGCEMAEESIDSGAAREALDTLIALTKNAP